MNLTPLHRRSSPVAARTVTSAGSGPTLRAGSQAGFTLVEALIASALLGFSLIVMFGFHSQAVRSNMHARKMTDCSYLAQLKMEQLMAVPWDASGVPATLTDLGTDSTSSANPWVLLSHVNGDEYGDPGAVDAQNVRVAATMPGYWVSWDVDYMDADPTWVRLRVRCVYEDRAFQNWRGTTISSYRFRDS